MSSTENVWFEISKKAIKKRTNKAILIVLGGPKIYDKKRIPAEYKFWMPLSQIKMDDKGDKIRITTPLWVIERSNEHILNHIVIQTNKD